jgi:hypothetical protein
MAISDNHIIEHCRAFCRENGDNGIKKDPAILTADPNFLGNSQETEKIQSTTLLHFPIELETKFDSSSIWPVFYDLSVFLSGNPLDPGPRIEQLCGLPQTAAGNEYRLFDTNISYLKKLEEACLNLAGMSVKIHERRMDFRVEKAGPWGGETAELVIRPLINHALSGMISIWIVAHPGNTNDNLCLTVDCLQLAQPNWIPDLIAGYRADFFDWQHIWNNFCLLTNSILRSDKACSPERWEIADFDILTGDIKESISSHPSILKLIRASSSRTRSGTERRNSVLSE